MLEITVPATELYVEETQEFLDIKEQTLQLEHSLVALAKWEAKWHRGFITRKDLSMEELVDYVRCMTLNEVDPNVYVALTPRNLEDIKNYLADPMTATKFSEHEKKTRASSETITSELIYYWMVALQIPFECQYWHLNRLLTLIRICNIKNQSPKKMGKSSIMKQNAALNAARRKQLNSRG